MVVAMVVIVVVAMAFVVVVPMVVVVVVPGDFLPVTVASDSLGVLVTSAKKHLHIIYVEKRMMC